MVVGYLVLISMVQIFNDGGKFFFFFGVILVVKN